MRVRLSFGVNNLSETVKKIAAKSKRSNVARKSQKSGATGEAIALAHLSALFACVKKIETGWRIKWQGGRVVGATPIRKMEGDFRAVVRGSGRAVLAEVKRRGGGILRHSDLEPHQHRALSENRDAGGLSLVVFIVPGDCFVIDYKHLPTVAPIDVGTARMLNGKFF